MARLNQNTETVSFSLQTWLIEVLEKICFEKDFSKSKFVSRAIKYYILHQINSPGLWLKVYTDFMGKSKQ